MYRTLMKSKIHRATVTQADLHYVGSLTISGDLMAEADLVSGEKVDIVDIGSDPAKAPDSGSLIRGDLVEAAEPV